MQLVSKKQDPQLYLNSVATGPMMDLFLGLTIRPFLPKLSPELHSLLSNWHSISKTFSLDALRLDGQLPLFFTI